MNTTTPRTAQDIATFMACPLGGLRQVTPKTAVVVGAPVALTHGNGDGLADGARAIRAASLGILQRYTASPSRTVIDIESGRRSRLKQPLACLDLGDLVIDQARGSETASVLAGVAQRIIGMQALPVLIGGERAAFAALADAGARADDVAVLLISPQSNVPGPAASRPVASLGTNGLQNAAEWAALTASGTIVTADDVHARGVDFALAKLGEFLSAYRAIHCQLDMAVLDTGYAAGTPDTNIGGLTPEQLIAILDGLDVSARLAGVAVTNVAPARDLRAQSEWVAAEALMRFLAPYLVDELA